jgi:hypothetical protein
MDAGYRRVFHGRFAGILRHSERGVQDRHLTTEGRDERRSVQAALVNHFQSPRVFEKLKYPARQIVSRLTGEMSRASRRRDRTGLEGASAAAILLSGFPNPFASASTPTIVKPTLRIKLERVVPSSA